MARKADPEAIERLKEAIEQYPGERAAFFARLLGWRREKISRALTSFQHKGILVSEDERGGLWPFDPD